jgi:hypothetical protein
MNQTHSVRWRLEGLKGFRFDSDSLALRQTSERFGVAH